MSNLASGVNKQVIYAKETTFGVQATASAGKRLRRVSAEINLTRASYESAEITSTAQTSDMRLGTDKVEGSLKAELSPTSYSDLFAGALRGPWVAGVTSTSTAIGVVLGLFNRATGSFLTDGFKVGDVITVSGFVSPANNGIFTVTAVTATDMTVDATLVNVVAGPAITAAVNGKKLVIPLTGRTNDSFTFESYFDSLAISEVATGLRMDGVSISVQPNAMATVDFSMVGRTMTQLAGSQYFTTPTAAPTTSVMSGSKGSLYVAGVKVATVTGFKLDIKGNMAEATVVGARQVPDILPGRITASGEMSIYFQDSTMFNNFTNETSISVVFRLDGDNGSVFAIKVPRIKISGTSKNDTETGGIVQTVPFTALLPLVSADQDQSTVVFQEA